MIESNQAMAVVNFSMLTDKEEGETVFLKLDPKHQISHCKSMLQSGMFHCACSSETIQETEIHFEERKEEQETMVMQSQDPTMMQLADQDPTMMQLAETQETLQIDLGLSSSILNTRFKIIKDESQDIINMILLSEPLPESFAMHKNETVKLITVIDSGGQPEYIHMLPAINNCPTINFVVHDMTKKLDDPVIVHYNSEHNKNFTEYPLHYSNLDMIGLLMSLTTDSLEQPTKQTTRVTTPPKSYVGFVGTHKDKLEKRACKETILTINNRLACMVEERNCRFAVLSADTGILFPVDNTTAGDSECEDITVKQLRQKVGHFMDGLIKSSSTTNQLPIRWMILDLELQQLHENSNTKYITCEQYNTIALEKASMVEEEAKESLQYFDFLGVLLHFKEVPDLCNYVFINHQWLFDKLAMIMHLSPERINFHDHTFKNQFKNKRLLAKNELHILEWNCELPPKCFFDLLDYLKVIAVVKLNDIEYYYMPCILMSTTRYDDKYRFLQSEPLLVQFSSGFLPRGFFCSLVVHLLQDLPDGWDHQLHNTKHYSNVATFSLPDKTFLRLHDKIFYLEVQVRHYEGNVDISYHSMIFLVLCKYFDKVCKKLNFNSEKLQYGFLCHDGDSDDDHIAVIKSLASPLPNEVTCCRKCPHLTKLSKLHKIWFEEVSDHKPT